MEIGIYSFGERTIDPETGRLISPEERFAACWKKSNWPIKSDWTSSASANTTGPINRFCSGHRVGGCS